MLKRMIALALCLVCLLLSFAACAKSENDKGAYIRMYLGNPVYDLDPLKAHESAAAQQIVSLLFQGLFVADEDGDVEPSLVEDYEYIVDEEENKYVLSLTLKESMWSDGVAISATDAQYAFLRLFDTNVSHPLKAALYDIKNARAIAAADAPVGHLGVVAKDQSTLEIEFERDIDVDSFLVNLCNPALFPLRSDPIEKYPNDWSKNLVSIVFSGPFIMKSMSFTEKDGFVLERNSYYYRDRLEDAEDATVKPYRLIIDFSTPADKQFANFNKDEKGALQYFGYIPLACRTDANAEIFEDADITFAPSTHVIYLNENAIVNGQPLFAGSAVRLALSKALNREDIAKALMFAVAADGLVPHGVLNRADKGASFRDKAEAYLAATPAVEEAKQLLAEAGVTPSAFSFTLTVNGSNEEHVKIGELTVAAWKALGFNVTLNALSYEEVMDVTDPENPVGTGLYENAYNTALATGTFEAISLDLIAPTPTAFSYLAPFAKEFSGNAINFSTDIVNPTYQLAPHITGYDSERYSRLIEAAYAAESEKERAELLHEAEELLLTIDMPVIPVVYNQNVKLCSDGLSGVESTFYCPGFFMETKLSNYWELAIRDGFVKEETED